MSWLESPVTLVLSQDRYAKPDSVLLTYFVQNSHPSPRHPFVSLSQCPRSDTHPPPPPPPPSPDILAEEGAAAAVAWGRKVDMRLGR